VRTPTDTQGMLRSSLETAQSFSGSLPSQYHYRCPRDFALREGQFFEPRQLPKEIDRGIPNECFRNAFLAALNRKLPYVEGYALDSSQSSLPILHAWNLDRDGCVVDTTWETVGSAYLGTIFPLPALCDTRGRSTIDDWQNRWPLLREPWRVSGRIDESRVRWRGP
jgi:hypothetical protein